MVVKHRAPSDSYIHTLHADDKLQLQYGNADQLEQASLGRATLSGSITSSGSSSSRPPLLPSFSSSALATDISKAFRLASLVPTLVKICFFTTAFYCIYTLRTKLEIRDNELLSIRSDFKYIEEALVVTEDEVNRAQRSLLNMQSKFISLLPEGQDNVFKKGDEFNRERTFKRIVNRQDAMKRRVNELQNTIAGLHHAEALEHFGPGPHRLQFNLAFDTEIFSFVVEMAPMDLMPHSVNYFLEQIKAHVWDKTIFTYGVNHILFAKLQDAEGNQKRHLLSEIDLSSLAFPEYSRDYPHHKYTLGFSGRPGGPGFYINTDDNVIIHGPGGQAHHALHEEADPCFGKVVEGHHVIDWMQERKKKSGGKGENLNEMYTVIESIRIIQ